jgi:hypothetical protein
MRRPAATEHRITPRSTTTGPPSRIGSRRRKRSHRRFMRFNTWSRTVRIWLHRLRLYGFLDGPHILLSLLWSSFVEIYRTRNVAGVVVTYEKRYDLPSVEGMYRYGVPVYVCWSERDRGGSYHKLPDTRAIERWSPPRGAFDALNQLPVQQPPPLIPQSPHSSLPPPPNAHADRRPLEYVEKRKASIGSGALAE